jgi:hypothetical protein
LVKSEVLRRFTLPVQQNRYENGKDDRERGRGCQPGSADPNCHGQNCAGQTKPLINAGAQRFGVDHSPGCRVESLQEVIHVGASEDLE